MTKRTIDQINDLLDVVSEFEEIEEVYKSVEKKLCVAKAKKFVESKRNFLKNRGYWVSKDEDDELKKDATFISVQLAVELCIVSLTYDDGAEIAEVLCEEELFQLLRLDSITWENHFDVNNLDWSKIKLDRDAFDDPYRGGTEGKIYVYVKRQPPPSGDEKLTIFHLGEMFSCVIKNGKLVSDGTDVEICNLDDWENENFFDFKKLEVAEPYALFEK